MIFYDIMIQDYQPEKAGAGKQVSRPAADLCAYCYLPSPEAIHPVYASVHC